MQDNDFDAYMTAQKAILKDQMDQADHLQRDNSINLHALSEIKASAKKRLANDHSKKQKARLSKITHDISPLVYTEIEVTKLLNKSIMTLYRWREKCEETGDMSAYPPFKLAGSRRVYPCDLFNEWLNT